AARDDQQPSAARDDQQPSAARDDQQPSAARDDQQPSAARDDQQPSAARDDQQPSAARDDQQPSAARDGLEFSDKPHPATAQRLARPDLSAPLPDAEAHLPLDARLDLRPSAAQLVRALRVPPAPVPPLTTRAISAPLRTHLARHEIKSMDTERLRARAHREGVSLHAAISSCALLAAAQALDVEHGRLRLHTPISLRARCRPEPRGFGVFIAGVDADLDVTTSSDPWHVAHQYAEQLSRHKPDAPGQLGLLALGGDLRERAEKLERQHHGRTATLEVSNVGRVLDVPDGTIIWLTQGAHYHAPLFVLTLVESAGVVRACLSVPHPLVDNDRSGRFIQAFREKLRQASRG
ncbi:MAG TPA: hypothetical protein VFN67_10410, partial [Polyangiales bacterium]|nr:hypothetical protein [Polyangiales bacterium]